MRIISYYDYTHPNFENKRLKYICERLDPYTLAIYILR